MNINYVKNGKNEFETTKLIDKYDNKKKIISDTKKKENFRKEEW